MTAKSIAVAVVLILTIKGISIAQDDPIYPEPRTELANEPNKISTKPRKKDNLIFIQGRSKDPTENWTSFGRFLVSEGFTFSSKDKDFVTLVTNEMTSKGAFKYKLSISFEDSLIKIRPSCNYLMMGSSIYNYQLEWTGWEYTRSKNSAQGLAYSVFDPILRKYNGVLYFTRE